MTLPPAKPVKRVTFSSSQYQMKSLVVDRLFLFCRKVNYLTTFNYNNLMITISNTRQSCWSDILMTSIDIGKGETLSKAIVERLFQFNKLVWNWFFKYCMKYDFPLYGCYSRDVTGYQITKGMPFWTELHCNWNWCLVVIGAL